MRKIAWPAFALLGGVLWATCFNETVFTVAPWLALVPLILLLDGPRPGLLGLLWGFSFWLASMIWIPPTLVTFGSIPIWLSWLLFALLSVYLGSFVGAFTWLAKRVWRAGSPGLAMLGIPAIWLVLEWVRTWLLGGFPWNLAAYGWIGVPGALESSAWFGAYGVSWLAIWVSTGLGLGLARRDWRVAAWSLMIAVCVLGVAWRWQVRTQLDVPRGPVLEVRLLQPNIPNRPVWDPEQNRLDYQRLIAQSNEACDRPGLLIVWPESAAWPRKLGSNVELERDLRLLNEKGCSVLLNAARQDDGVYFNSAYIVRTDGTRPWYDKRHLVPFGEYVPFGPLFSFFESLTRNVGDFTPAEEVRLLELEPHRFGMAICYEVVFPGEVAATLREGATALISITNDDWYGPTAAPWQHLRAAQFRAAETRRLLMRAAITGVSAVIAPNGDLQSVAPPGVEARLEAAVVPREDLTLYVRFGGALPWLALALSCFAIFRAGRRPKGRIGS